MRKRYTVTGQMFGYKKGDVITLDAEKVEAQGLLTKLREIPGDVEEPVGEPVPAEGSGAVDPQKEPVPASTPTVPAAAPAPAAKAEAKAAAPAAKVPGGPPMPGAKAVVTPEPGK